MKPKTCKGSGLPANLPKQFDKPRSVNPSVRCPVCKQAITAFENKICIHDGEPLEGIDKTISEQLLYKGELEQSAQ